MDTIEWRRILMALDPKVRMDYLMSHINPSMRYDGKEDFATWQERARAKLAEVVGYEQEVCEPNFRIEWVHEEKGFTEYRFLFESEPDVDVACHFLVPSCGKSEKLPVVICLQGHSKGMHISLGRIKYDGDAQSINGGDRDFAVQIVKRGQIALVVEQRGFGERGGTPQGTACQQPAVQAMLIGKTLIGQRCWDISRAIDVIAEHFPQADMDKVALMGNSGGGTATCYAAALDTRIKAAMPSCAYCGYRASIGVQRHCLCNYVPGIMNYFDMGDLGALVAPRPFIVINGVDDTSFPLWAAQEQAKVTAAAYQAAGAPEMFEHIVGPQGHRFYAALGWPVFDKLTGWKEVKTMKLILCGDICPTEDTAPAYEARDAKALMGEAVSVLKSGDFAIGNLECALTDTNNPIRKCGPNLKGGFDYAKTLKDCGFTHLGLSNNHTMDFGIAGFRDTIAAVKDAGMVPFGYGENDQDSRKIQYIEKDNVKVAVVAVCEHEYSYALHDQMGANPFDPFDTMEDISIAKANADKVIVMYHGGKEQCEYPSPRLRKACKAMVRAGADVVLCQHSHCIGCHERYNGSEIVYGEGNFCFLHLNKTSEQWECGLMIRANLGEFVHLEYIPVVVTSTGITLAEGEHRKEILAAFEERSNILKNEEEWLEKWNEFCNSPERAYYYASPERAVKDIPEGEKIGQVFPHYLDCEAHLDVWKTIFKTWHGDKTDNA